MPLLLLALLSPSLAGPFRRAQPAPAPPPVAVPGPASPLDATVPTPSLEGHTASLQLEALNRRSTRYHFAIDTGPLAALGPEDALRLQRHLAADPRWRVEDLDGARVAALRVPAPEGPTAPRSGYHLGDAACHRVLLRFSPLDPASDWSTSGSIARLDAGVDDVAPLVFASDRGPCARRSATAVSLTGPQVSLDIYEAEDGGERPITEAALVAAVELAAQVPLTGPLIDQRGYDPLLLPADEPAPPRASVVVSSPGPGQLAVRARLNPGAAGWTWVRLLVDGEPWADDAVGPGSRERIGWSPDEEAGFLMQGVFPVPSGPAAPATAEVWFQADDSSEPRRLLEAAVTLPAR